MRESMLKKVVVNVLLLISVMVFLGLSLKSLAGVSPITRSTVQKTKAVHITYRSMNSIYKKLHKKCGKFFTPKRMISGEDPRRFYSVEIVSVMPKQKTATALCVSKVYKDDDVVTVE